MPTAPPPEESGTAPSETARVAGRGGLAISFAKVYFIFQGLLQQVLLPRALGLDGYGALASVLSAASIAYNPIVTTSIQGVSRAVARSSPEERPATLRRTFLVHAAFAVVACVAFQLAVPLVSGFMRAPHIERPLRVGGLVLLFYGFYSPLIGALNGQRRFLAQASFDIVTSTLRTIALVVGGALAARSGRGVEGAITGFVGVSALVFVLAALLVGSGARGPGGPTVREQVTFVAPLFAAQILLNLLLQADLTLLRRFAGDAARAVDLPSAAADPFVGAYRATQLYAFLPYQLLVSITFILFPLLAEAERARDRARIAAYVSSGVRIALLASGLLVSVTSGLSGPLLRLVYSRDVAALGTDAMHVLTLGFGAFAIFGVLTAILSSLGKERWAVAGTAAAVGLIVVLCSAWASGAALGPDLLRRTALSTSAGLVVAACFSSWLVWRAAGAVASPKTLLRTLASLGAAIALGRYLPEGGRLWTLAACLGVASAYLLLLVVTGELRGRDLETLRTILSRRRS